MGVKSLWSLLTPVGRPVMLETIEGKVLAIDSSIWIYQFQATMRDKDGRALVNAHVLGFLRRICKLLFYGIKPVFVFDGGAPVLKRLTISERKKKKTGAAASHVKLAEKLLAAQMRREALSHAQPPQASTSKNKTKSPSGPVTLDDDTVYLEDIDNTHPKTLYKTPSKDKGKEKSQDPSSTSSKKKPRFHDHDPYRLPELNLSEKISTATHSTLPDPRLATEDELRTFIEDMRPEDFDVTTPAFRELPTEVQYEIVGDLRLKSRQTSYKRLQGMLQEAPTPLDFSRQQIKNLKQRNLLTQQLLMTTDSIGKAHLSIPVRIASERNKEYVLVKNEGEGGGWVLGIRDEGTVDKPIEVDRDSDAEGDQDREGDDEGHSEMEMEEVNIPGAAQPDSDLREYQRGLALSAIDERASKTKPSRPIQRRHQAKPLFDFDSEEDDSDDGDHFPVVIEDDSDDNPQLAFALQESMDQSNASRPSEMTHVTPSPKGQTTNAHSSPSTSTSAHHLPTPHRSSSSLRRVDRDSDDEDMYGSRLETALAIANAGPSRRPQHHISPHSSPFRKPELLNTSHSASPLSFSVKNLPKSDEDDDDDMEEVILVSPAASSRARPSPRGQPSVLPVAQRERPLAISPTPRAESDEEMEEVTPLQPAPHISELSTKRLQAKSQPPPLLQRDIPPPPLFDAEASSPVKVLSYDHTLTTAPTPSPSRPLDFSAEQGAYQADSEDDGEALTDWSRSPSPIIGLSTEAEALRPPSPAHETWDAAQEMDPHAEEGEFARFMSQVKGRDLDDVRAEIDEEIKSLNQQKKAAMRDSDDITQQMISQIMLMLRLFGIPYITAPMEAEAQCAELVSLGLVEGIITDDSDVFLFGGLRVFKNMFNQSKTVECFFLSDLGRELGLDRDTLVRLAYLLGSDYVEGLPGVGPVVAMELLKEFPGEDGLHKFKDWWMKVQTGKDKPDDNKSKFRKRFKKKFKELYLPNEWPNPAVRDAYYHPTVDESDEPFKWGLPDLDALRGFLRAELGWHQTKVDDLLLPIIQKVGKRGQAAAMNKQGNLNDFFDVSAGNGTYAPRKRQAYSSKRLQQVVSEFRSEKAKLQKDHSPTPAVSEGSNKSGADNDTEEGPAKKRRKTKPKGKLKERAGVEDSTRKTAGRGKGRGRGTTTASTSRKKATSKSTDSEEDEDEYVGDIGDVVGFVPQLRPRPKPKPAYKGKVRSDPDVDDGT